MGNCLPVSASFSSNSSASFPNSFIRTPQSSNLMAIRKRRPSDAFWDSSKRTRALQMEVAAVLATPTDDIGQHYDMRKELGSGQFGVIRQCTDKRTGESFACKSIAKARLTSRQDVEDVRNEIEIMSHLSGHSNIVQLIDVFEDMAYVHIVMELCLGGELFDRIVQRKSYPESEAASVIKSLVEVVKHCHERGVIHRDLKPENILLATTSPSSPIKVADFGLALRFNPGQRFSGMAGSAYYIAPEILNGNYSEEVDMWSVGVIQYILLSGVPPFWGETEQQIFGAINEAKIDFLSDPWSQISDAAKDLIQGLLCVNATTRLTPDQVLMHPWILRHTSQPALSQENREMRPESLEIRPGASKTEEPIREVALQDYTSQPPQIQENREMKPHNLESSPKGSKPEETVREVALHDWSTGGHCDIEPPEEAVPAHKNIWRPKSMPPAHSLATTASGYPVSNSPGQLPTVPCSIFHQGLGETSEDSSDNFEVAVDTLLSPVPTHQGFGIHPVSPPTVHSASVPSSRFSLSSLSGRAPPALFENDQKPDISPVFASKVHLDASSPTTSSFPSLSPFLDDFDRCTSFSQFAELTFVDFLGTMMEDGYTCTILKGQREGLHGIDRFKKRTVLGCV